MPEEKKNKREEIKEEIKSSKENKVKKTEINSKTLPSSKEERANRYYDLKDENEYLKKQIELNQNKMKMYKNKKKYIGWLQN